MWCGVVYVVRGGGCGVVSSLKPQSSASHMRISAAVAKPCGGAKVSGAEPPTANDILA